MAPLPAMANPAHGEEAKHVARTPRRQVGFVVTPKPELDPIG
jgi:hypothetical protein